MIRWELPTGTEIDTGFRSDDKSVYPAWVGAGKPDGKTDSEDSANAASSGEVEQNGENA